MMPAPGARDTRLRIQREFDFPRERVFDAWTNAALLPQWFAPYGCTLHVNRLDIRAGGGFHWCVRSPTFDCWTIGVYLEVIRPERLVFTSAIADADGNRATSASQGHDPAWPAETTITVTFAEQAGKTIVTLEQNVSEALAKETGAYPSWMEMLERLARELARACLQVSRPL